MAGEGFQMTGDARDIPLALGLVAMSWNRCESRLRGMVISIACRGHFENRGAVEVIVTELGTVGITQALQCYSKEFPEDCKDLGECLRVGVEWAERLKAYRNYYMHAISAVTKYGLVFTEQMMHDETPLHEAMTVGPYGMLLQRSAKGKSKFTQDFITAQTINKLNDQLIALEEYLDRVSVSINHYFRAAEWRKSAPLPPLPSLPDALQKPDLLPLLRHLPPPLGRDEDLIARVKREHREDEEFDRERERRPTADKKD